MPKREGYVYDKMWDWGTLKQADKTACHRKKNYGVKKHAGQWLKDLVHVQELIYNRQMKTGNYKFETRISGQDKVRQIAKLEFMPNHIEHQCLVIAGDKRIEKALINHTYASRIGYGQIKAAMQIKRWLVEHPEECAWYGQYDIVHYYATCQHSILENNLRRIFKDEEYIQAYMEPFRVFAPDGVGFPLGARPSQGGGNLELMTFDRFMKETVRVKHYLRYLDDFVVFGRTKGEVWRYMKRAEKFLNELGFELHAPKVRPISEGLNMLGFVSYEGGDQYWRKSNKRRWLKHRARLSNPRRIAELDSAAWSMLSWGNRHCKKLYVMKTGISMEQLGIKMPEKRDKDGKRIIDAPKISTSTVLGNEIEVVDWVRNVKTVHGEGRYALELILYGRHHKLIANSTDIKAVIDAMEGAGVTSFTATMRDKGGNRFCFENVCVTSIRKRKIMQAEDGKVCFEDTGEQVNV